MANSSYAIVFDGKIKDGFTTDQVKANFAKVFKTDITRVEALFSGKTVVIKKDLDKANAAKYHQVLQKAGAETRVMAQKPAATSPVPAPGPAGGQPDVLPAGADLLRPEERRKVQAVDVDISHLAVERNVATFGPVDEEEPEKQSAPPETAAPDFDLAPVGADMSDAPEAVELPEPDLSAFSIAEVGADVLAEKPAAAVAPELDLSQLSVAEQEGELYPERPKQETPAAPDTSHISLAD